MTNDIVILSAVRTAIGTFGGSLSGIAPCDLGVSVAKEAIARSGVDAAQIGQTVMGNVIHTEPRDMYLSRVTAIGAGVPETSPSLTLNRLCGSGLQAVVTAFEQISLGHCEAALAGGAESMSRAGHLLSSARFGQKMGDVSATDMMIGALTDPFGNGHMGITAENVAERDGITREQQDATAAESHRRAAHAQAEGYFDSQILPVEVRKGRKTDTFARDEMVRSDASAEGLATLRAAFRKDGSVTAGNASGINDGAAALVLARADLAGDAKPLARIVATGLGGVAPEVMGLGPVPATQQALSRAGLTVSDLDVIESNEAFAAQACAVSKQLGLDPAKVNPNGGAIALGHPIGASGAIILTKLLYELERTGGRYGLATMCIGGGQGIAVIVENLRR
ncbi:MAG: acetyl-CoA C-acyltransferase [Rhodobacteraceae bacterium]|jgi:acetyl-CoA C-acetyltransferase|uniref:Acetyl-CoA C-acetyltransferase n=1 Tax=Salipiger profundus TaxID=1229727 RepID=A0A1U7DA13_9RHOB|nr:MULTISPECIES: beta-ketothiolase BktB [Salipiger]APX25001.1 acetyl-CoA C-acetyltransferase [Salipiger profundus]MAB07512.1 acetyl-CoA C-acyltransferase [Paracoccaceae bacterium]GGA14770.1 3-ketoacyl-CoA thiolase [Salipiger profundus]SFD13158.1 acetyl-CoA C-acetyltransferase [Salipiger profundus]